MNAETMDGEDPFQTQPSQTQTENRGRYQFRRALAVGGLGVVSIYFDTELNREVALKEIREQCADDPRHRDSFCAEAEVTGLLEHPGVVPIYSMGTGVNGRPYYAMRLITGSELRNHIKQFHEAVAAGKESFVGPRLRQLLQRLIDVCNVLHYAHSRGVLHRDLKSNNVMLGRYGETLVIDWGLAKTTGSSEVEYESTPAATEPLPESPVSVSSSKLDDTRVGTAMGTIAYAPPEQLNGRIQDIDSRSDLYSIGAMLYEILTGNPPCKGMSLTQALKAIESGSIPAAIEVQTSTPRSLNAIAAKSISRLRENRYQSAGELRDDLQRWLDDEPVSAYQESPLERLYRWKRQHETFVRWATVSLILLTLTSLFAVHRINQARKQQQQARGEATELYKLARQATDRLLTGASERLKEVPDATDVREQLLTDAAESYQRMAEFPSREPELRRESAAVSLELAKVQRELGLIPNALASLSNASKILQELDTKQDHRMLARVMIESSRLHADQGDTAAATTTLTRAMPIVDQVMIDSRTSADALLLRGQAMIQKGVIAFDEQRWLPAVEAFESASRSLRDAMDKSIEPGLNREIRFELTRALNNEALGRLELMWSTQTTDKRIADRYQDAIEQARWLVTRDPNDIAAAKEYALLLRNYAEHLQLDVADIDGAKSLFAESIQFFSGMVEKYPAIPQLKERQVLALTGLGNLLIDQGDVDAAISQYERAVKLADQMLLQNSVQLSFRRCAAQAYLALGTSLVSSKPAVAEANLHKAIETLPNTNETLDWADEIRQNAEQTLKQLDTVDVS
ncbi:serine/threonine protein kinase [Rhodopirellula maiorica SM1]|uniref:Serine/threonine protein kinase n=1 Tax=Rhodopirellula maiorica SM1 TaxID=1265738 RepID=M5RWV8_9BACT|nr:serine/threonine-protein kinase [Rhodopirellula maiorica]EMI19887.1 serine/threonine protein kinase [Rhodopirellula maiorica SM1]